MRLRVQRPDDQPGVAPGLLADQPARLVRPRQRRSVEPRALRRALQVPRLELRVHDDADRAAPHELPGRAHGHAASVRDRPGRWAGHGRSHGTRRRNVPPRVRPQAGRGREGVRARPEPQDDVGHGLGLPARGRQGRWSASPHQVREALLEGQLRQPVPDGRRSQVRARGQGHDPGAGPGRRPHRGDRHPRGAVQP